MKPHIYLTVRTAFVDSIRNQLCSSKLSPYITAVAFYGVASIFREIRDRFVGFTIYHCLAFLALAVATLVYATYRAHRSSASTHHNIKLAEVSALIIIVSLAATVGTVLPVGLTDDERDSSQRIQTTIKDEPELIETGKHSKQALSKIFTEDARVYASIPDEAPRGASKSPDPFDQNGLNQIEGHYDYAEKMPDKMAYHHLGNPIPGYDPLRIYSVVISKYAAYDLVRHSLGEYYSVYIFRKLPSESDWRIWFMQGGLSELGANTQYLNLKGWLQSTTGLHPPFNPRQRYQLK